jgi:predicted extracellular nuclease
LLPGDSTLLTVTVVPGLNPPSTGIAVLADLAGIGGSTSQAFFDDATHGDVTAGDNVFSFETTVAIGVPVGVKSLPILIVDAQSRAGTASLTLAVADMRTIHDIQGPGGLSPIAGEFTGTSGIVTGIRFNNGFFIQAPDAEADTDPNTSEGIFVYTGSAPPAAAVVGSLVRVVGLVQEYIPASDPYSPSVTEIAGSGSPDIPVAVTVVGVGHDLPDAVTLTAADTDPAGGPEQLERYEGMRVHADSLLVVAPTEGTITESSGNGTSDGVFYGVLPGIARPFLEPGVVVGDPLPPSSPCCVTRFDGNPERIRVNSYGLKGAARIEVTSGATVTDITGPLDYVYRSYTILPDPGTLSKDSVSGNLAAIPVPEACPAELTVATANVQRLGATFQSAAGLTKRLAKLSLAIRNVMKLPDIIGVEEVSDLATLQAISARVSADANAADQPDPQYAARLEPGNDSSGINVGFLVKTPKVTVLDVVQVGKDATFVDPRDGSTDVLNDRPPLVMHAAVQTPGGTLFPVTVIVNHLRSLTDINADPGAGPFARAKRRAEAEFLANLIQEHQLEGENVVSVGDYNATQFSDGYVDVIGTILGTPVPADQVVLATSPGLVDPTLTDLLDLAPADQRYSYVYDGNAQEIDHVLVTAGLLPSVNGLYYARDNADFPESYRSDASRPERYADHDPVVAYLELLPVIGNVAVSPAVLWPANHKLVTVTVGYDLQTACPGNPASAALSVASNEPVEGTGDGDTAPDWIVVDPHHVKLRAERAGMGNGRTYTITITATDSRGKITTKEVTVTVPHNK